MEFLSQMLIGDVARLSNTTPATIRYYEELGLLTKPARSQGGYRHYGDKAIDEIQFMRNQPAPSACNSSGLCEIINSAELPSKGSNSF